LRGRAGDLLRARLRAHPGHEPAGDQGQDQARARHLTQRGVEPGARGDEGRPVTAQWSWERAREALPVLWDGFQITLLATVLGFALAAALGLVIAIVRHSLPRAIAAPVHAVSEFVRLTPLVVQLLFAYTLFTQFSALQIGVVVLGIHYSSYLAEVYRAGIEAVPPGQWEAARALSLPPLRTWRAVVLPQAIRASLPALGAN